MPAAQGQEAQAKSEGGQKDYIVFQEFEGMSTQAMRQALPEKKVAWCENLQPIGTNNLHTVGAPLAPLTFIVGETITEQFFAALGDIDYLINFTASGAGYAVNLANGAQIQFAPPGTFTPMPDMTVWQNQRILIFDSKAGYSTWDGTIFVKQGGVSPNIVLTNGGSYTGPVTVAISGGSGSGATATATVVGGIVTAIVLTNPGTGYLATDILTVTISGTSNPGTVTGGLITAGGNGFTSIPTVAITGGGGSGATAVAGVGTSGGPVTSITITNPGSGYTSLPTITVSGGGGTGATVTAEVSSVAEATVNVFPFISPNPTTGAVFEGRVFMASKRLITYTGTLGYDDFNPANASGTFTVSDSDLIDTITALRTIGNYLYVIGDNSVKEIGNLTVTGSITSFTLVTLSSDQGTTFRNSIISYNRLLLFTNTVGVYAVFGSSVEKISDDMDGVFQGTDFTQQPCAAVNDINNIHCFLLLVKYNDPLVGPRSIILSYMNKKWFVISQGSEISFISTAVINGITETFGTSGDDVTQLIQNLTGDTPIILRTALSSKGNPIQGKRVLRYAIAQLVTANNELNLLVESENNSQSIDYEVSPEITWINDLGEAVQWQSTVPSGPLAVVWQNNSSAAVQWQSVVSGPPVPLTWVNNSSAAVQWQNQGTSGPVPLIWVNNSSVAIQWQNNSAANITFQGTGFVNPVNVNFLGTSSVTADVNFLGVNYVNADVNFLTTQQFFYKTGRASASGVYIGATLSGTVNHYALNMIALELEMRNLFGSAVPP